MATAATLGSEHRELAENLLGLSELLTSKAKFHVAAFKLPFLILRSARLEKKEITAVREMFAICAANCESGTCAANMYKPISETRDKLIMISGELAKLPYPFSLYRRPLENSLHEWDDLAEDCLVASDKDIRSAINAIASLV